MEKVDLQETVKQIMRYYGLPLELQSRRIRNGFNRAVFDIDNRFILKICTDSEREDEVRNEIDFFKNNHYDFAPNLLVEDQSKEIVPYLYTVEEKIQGKTLFAHWGNMSEAERYRVLAKLVSILKKIHSKPCESEFDPFTMVCKFNYDIAKCEEMGIFDKDQLKYLRDLRDSFSYYLNGARSGYIHGDIHFDNVVMSPEGLKLIDFEMYGVHMLDKEFDEINRMCAAPESFTTRDGINERDYRGIMPNLEALYPEICDEAKFKKRLIVFDCMNALEWIQMYPDYDRYHQVLFREGKKLIRKI